MVVQKKIKKGEVHTFAFYVSSIKHNSIDKKIVLRDADLVHRMFRVVRLEAGHACVLFDKAQHALVTIVSIDKKEVVCEYNKVEQNKTPTPFATYLLPLLKKDALQEAVYSLVEVGINKIQLVITEKSRHSITDKEFERLKKTVIAAAEQAKNYTLSELCEPKSLLTVMQTLPNQDEKILFDETGGSFFQLREALIQKPFVLLIGPEGGLSSDERKKAQDYSFKLCVLTSTILRAVQAAAISAGLFRLR